MTRARALAAIAALALLPAVAGWALSRWTSVPFLVPEGGARWIQPDVPFELYTEPDGLRVVSYRFRFRTGRPPGGAVLTIKGLKGTEASLDGLPILGIPGDVSAWKSGRRVDLAPFLAAGDHLLEISVANRSGPPLLLAHCGALGIATGGPGWEAREGARGWKAPRLADDPGRVPGRELYPGAADAFARSAPFLAGCFLAGAFAAWAAGRAKSRFPVPAGRILRASRFRWLLVAAWVGLWANNLGWLPKAFGFDGFGHSDYIEFLLKNRRLPLPSDGWVMNHPPLFYLACAAVHSKALSLGASWYAAGALVRLIPFLCGVLQVEVAFRALRRAFPGREELQSLGTLVAGFAPAGLYMSQAVTNDPMAGLLCAVAFLLAAALLERPPGSPALRPLLLLGATCGLALLTKLSALFMLPAVVAAVAASPRPPGRAARTAALRVSAVLGTALAISGWYYLRNLAVYGKPFLGNWDPVVCAPWWQGPGFRTPAYYLSFGESLRRPVYSGLYGFWDSIHSTLWLDGYLSGVVPEDPLMFWKIDLVAAGAWLGLLPLATLLAGAWRTLSGKAGPREAPHLRLALLAAASHLGALAAMSLLAPNYSAVKAGYVLGILPCLGLLAAAGADRAVRTPLSRSLAWGAAACWAAASLGAYSVRG